MFIDAATYSKSYEPFCSQENISDLNPLAIKNRNGVVYGQLLGDGQGVNSSSAFEVIQICLPLSKNIRIWPNFDTVDVALLTSTGELEPMLLSPSNFSVSNVNEVCFNITHDGVYFPVRRAAITDIGNIVCTQSCRNGSSICLYNAVSSSTQCVCNCGFSGTKCDTGCINSCSNNGVCSSNSCICNVGYTGIDCSVYDCPVGGSLQLTCSGNGVCLQVTN